MMSIEGRAPWIPIAALLPCLFWSASCEGEDEGAPLLSVCEKDDDCDSGHCIDNVDKSTGSPEDLNTSRFKFCSEPCEGSCPGSEEDGEDADDDVPVCGFGAEGEGWCVFSCTTGQIAEDEVEAFVCEDGVPRACEEVSDPDCMFCGCPDGSFCELSTRSCRSRACVDQECNEHSGCESGHCNFTTGRCEIPLGEPCDTGTCSDCATLDDASYCTQACASDNACSPGWRCISFEGEEEDFFCRKVCEAPDDSCPLDNEQCVEVADDGTLVCTG